MFISGMTLYVAALGRLLVDSGVSNLDFSFFPPSSSKGRLAPDELNRDTCIPLACHSPGYRIGQ